MSTRSIAEPLFVDTADLRRTQSATEYPDSGHDSFEQPAARQAAYGLESLAADRLSNVNRWLVSDARRCMDIAVAAIALLIFLPVILPIMLIVRVSSRGPILFRQRRAGRNREEFTLYKFRSMRDANSPGAEITVSGDPRITPVGVFLRRHKLDELPQFWNVLKGNMSLVGPRPKLPHHEGLDLQYRPGITGMATLVFRNEEEILSVLPPDQLDAFYEICIKPRKAHLDLEYMRRATFWTDMKLLWRTAVFCIFGPDDLSFEETKELFRLAVVWADPACNVSRISSSATNTPFGGRGTDLINVN
jgi:lipopolysaccharide/colanic/teichoic acid biosynthesis glycosyltransferase